MGAGGTGSETAPLNTLSLFPAPHGEVASPVQAIEQSASTTFVAASSTFSPQSFLSKISWSCKWVGVGG